MFCFYVMYVERIIVRARPRHVPRNPSAQGSCQSQSRSESQSQNQPGARAEREPEPMSPCPPRSESQWSARARATTSDHQAPRRRATKLEQYILFQCMLLLCCFCHKFPLLSSISTMGSDESAVTHTFMKCIICCVSHIVYVHALQLCFTRRYS